MSLRLSVIGTGYLGAVHAAVMADLGHQVVAVDVDATKIELLASGRAPFYEPGLQELLERTLATGRLTFTSDHADAAAADVHFMCVGTPQRQGEYAADLTWVDAAVEALAPLLSRPALVVGKSTVPVGTAARLRRRLQQVAPAGQDVHLMWNPEFLREGFAVQDTLAPDRFVYGVTGPGADADVALLDQVYGAALGKGIPRLVTDLPTAELVKAAANSFLATKISFINAMSEVCEAAGADVAQLADAIGHDDRIGRKFLNAGLGFGGGCLPKDIRAFMARAGELGADGGADLPARGRRDQPASPLADGGAGPRTVRRDTDRQAGRGPRRGVQARQRRHPRLPRSGRRPCGAPGRRHCHGPRSQSTAGRPPCPPRPVLLRRDRGRMP